MAHLIQLTPTNTYATRENAIKAVEKRFGPNEPHFGSADCRYIVVQHTDGRWFPLFIGESAIRCGAHNWFNIAG